ncbi:MAG: class IV adenylate cyclase [Balneolaceae bacterium]|nr:class IV adenylate cyclase [Balneolaceae bacterium]
MDVLNVELKARCNDPDRIRKLLNERDAEFIGTDHQVDTYFEIPTGRLKLREGTIENNLIFYKRDDTADAKTSDIKLVPFDETDDIKALLKAALPVQIVVDKMREIYFLDNVKFHIDKVKQLGRFIEIEAIDKNNNIGEMTLHQQCKFYRNLFDIADEDLVATSYSNLLAD